GILHMRARDRDRARAGSAGRARRGKRAPLRWRQVSAFAPMMRAQTGEGQMNKTFVISVVVVFVVSMFLGFVVHGWLLAGEYQKLAGTLFRTPASAEQHFAYMLLAHVIMAIGITWVYRTGRDPARPWLMQGVRF